MKWHVAEASVRKVESDWLSPSGRVQTVIHDRGRQQLTSQVKGGAYRPVCAGASRFNSSGQLSTRLTFASRLLLLSSWTK